MSCSPFDLRDYFLKELPEEERREVESHLKGCQGCREELARLRLTETALLSLREEEIPRRIAFVSDKVFEPSPLARWWAAFWGSTARLGFASAAMLSVALVIFALARPAPAPAPTPAAAPQITAAHMEAEITRRVAEAVALSEARQARRTAELMAAAERRNEMDRKALLVAMDENFEFMRKRMNRIIVASNDLGPPRGPAGVPK